MTRKEMPAIALAMVPLLTAPVVVFSFWFAFQPNSLKGTFFFILFSVAFAWYLLGGAYGLRHLIQAANDRRELRGLRADLLGLPEAAFVAMPDGLILAQNNVLMDHLGDLVGRQVQEALGRSIANPDAVWRTLGVALGRRGQSRIDLGAAGTFVVTRKAGAHLQLWRFAPSVEPVSVEPPPQRQSDVIQFDELPVALLLLDAKATIMRANEAARDMLGRDLQGRPLAMLLEGPGRPLADWVGDACAGRMQVGAEVLRARDQGPEHFVQVTLKGGQGDCVTAVLSDASDLKRLEAQFVQSQKMQAIGQLAGGVAHDFNNLLTAISGHCDLLMLRHDKGDPDYADVDQISQNANRAAALVGQLLAYSRKQTLRLQLVDLRDSLSDLTHLLNRLVGEKIVLTFHHDPKLSLIRADKRQLEQVIMNLVVNARDAMPEGGDIAITTANITTDGPIISGHAQLLPGNYVRVEVRDQGTGIPVEHMGKVFEPFFSTKRTGEGTGLGLSTAYGIVKQTGGYIFCDSEIGEGTTFSLYFPAHAGEVADPDPDQAVSPRPSAAMLPRIEKEVTVLLVEDEAPVRAFASRALQLQGFKVLEAACAEDALELLSDQRLNVDVFVTDVVMPGMDGPAWVRTALRDRPATRVIFMSGYSEQIFAEGGSPIPHAAFLAKPFSLSELTALVSKQLEPAPMREEPEVTIFAAPHLDHEMHSL
ncbi:hybrid sensor histidine kinase/response regulator [Paracoccus aminophilus]|uniref:histidine kinase n=1 Tax=Paracoccus aminophilus JCM 7686 TaxID=1367847 RepID=S5XWF3_PARAH|nr:ATP-binding protein [Paracoccus aminophilus]AGT09607.1 two-component system, cell cycle sensor histidine kinase and response regulator CckA [Paracoccus aminophilus JCM 7686]